MVNSIYTLVSTTCEHNFRSSKSCQFRTLLRKSGIISASNLTLAQRKPSHSKQWFSSTNTHTVRSIGVANDIFPTPINGNTLTVTGTTSQLFTSTCCWAVCKCFAAAPLRTPYRTSSVNPSACATHNQTWRCVIEKRNKRSNRSRQLSGKLIAQ